MIKILPLPCDLPAVAPVVGSDPDGEIERAAYAALRRGDNIGAAALVLTIRNPFRRAAWLRNFRGATIMDARAQRAVVTPETVSPC